MTVEVLIAKLSKKDPKAQIFLRTGEGELNDIHWIEELTSTKSGEKAYLLQ